MLDHCKERFWKEGLDFLITFGEDGSTELRNELAGNFRKGDGGSVVVEIVKSGGLGQDAVVALKAQGTETGVRPSVVLLDEEAAETEGWKLLEAPQDAIDEVKQCVDRFRGFQKENAGTVEGHRAVADLLLYLVSELGTGVSGQVTADGGWKSF